MTIDARLHKVMSEQYLYSVTGNIIQYETLLLQQLIIPSFYTDIKSTILVGAGGKDIAELQESHLQKWKGFVGHFEEFCSVQRKLVESHL